MSIKKTTRKSKPKQKVNLLIIDDHQIVRDGIKTMLEIFDSAYEFKIFEAEDGLDAVDLIEKRKIELLILDYQLPKLTGVEVARAIAHHKLNVKILALSNYDEYHYIKDMILAGAHGFVLKDIGPEELILAIKTILSGKNYYSQNVTDKIIHFELPVKGRKKSLEYYDVGPLTPRQIEIIQLIAQEYTNDEISKFLNLQKRTIDSHRQLLLRKFGVKNTVGLIRVATLMNLI